jgi:hypothetical protein
MNYISNGKASMYIAASEAPDVYEKKKEKKVGWFTRWFDRKCRESWDRAKNESYPTPTVCTSPRLDANGLSLSIYGADGGTVLEFRHYDHKTERSSNSLHVIGQNENFEERVASCITMELLRKGITN